jgi:DNA-directed RNA polymerase subunit RPC12/RpoP
MYSDNIECWIKTNSLNSAAFVVRLKLSWLEKLRFTPMPEYKKFKCVFCGQSMEYDPKHAGRQIKCPACDHKIAIPGANPASDNPPQAQTWMTNVPAPDVSTPTRYKKTPPDQGPAETSE